MGYGSVIMDHARVTHFLDRLERMFVEAWLLVFRRSVTASMSKRNFG
jgi:hypothetical protein